MALVSGIAEAKIIEIRNEHVYNEVTRSVQKHGWLPGLFRGIIQKAKEILQVLIRETEIPPKPTLSIDQTGNGLFELGSLRNFVKSVSC